MALAQVTEQFEHESQFDISRSDLIRLGFLAGQTAVSAENI